MPVIKSAKKKLRQDHKRERVNNRLRTSLKEVLKMVKKHSSSENLQKAFSIIDKAAEKNIIHKNKAARIKSSLSKHIIKESPAKKSNLSKKTPPKSHHKKTIV